MRAEAPHLPLYFGARITPLKISNRQLLKSWSVPEYLKRLSSDALRTPGSGALHDEAVSENNETVRRRAGRDGEATKADP